MLIRWSVAVALAGTVAAGAWSATALAGRTDQARAERRQTALAEREHRVDAVFAKWNRSTPGCALGVAKHGSPVLAKGYGMADLEHDVPITPSTIFEAGSVSKQFTAAAVLLLARDGKLSIDDPARKYVPELPDYGAPLTIRHMLTHTSGLRDWGSVAAISGWPRTTRVHTHAHVLDIVSRQHALNFPPGTRWSYSNTGYNLAAIIVSRVSGMPFADFTRERIFKPLGMTSTSWRDDYTRIVKGRAIAYAERGGTFHTDMPFENVYGNGGLLTTVGDLLKWNENFVKPVIGDAAFVAEQQQPGKFNDGRTHDYAFGLTVGLHRGVREVSHSGSTAGYRAFLTRFPVRTLSVAVLCNVTTNATALAHAVADAYLFESGETGSVPGYVLTEQDARAIAGMYRDRAKGTVETIVADGRSGPRLQSGGRLNPTGPQRLVSENGTRWEFDGQGHARVIDEFGTTDELERVAPVKPTLGDLQAYAGTYASDEAEVEMAARVEGDTLVLHRRPDATIALTPLYADAFRGQSLGTFIFDRDASGRVAGFHIVQERVWKMPFVKKD